MRSGEAFTDAQVREISNAVTQASEDTGLYFSVFVGGVDGDIGSYAERLHAGLGADAPRAVLICISPGDRELRIVTGEQSSRRLVDQSCALAAMAMTASFHGGELVGGIVAGVRLMAQTAGRVRASQAG